MLTEADTCRQCVTPLLPKAGWDEDPHSIAEQRYFTVGRIIVRGNKTERRKGKRANYLRRYTGDFPIADVEAKAENEEAATGLQQAKDYAEILNTDLVGYPRPSDIPSPVGRERVAEGRVREQREWRGAGGDGGPSPDYVCRVTDDEGDIGRDHMFEGKAEGQRLNAEVNPNRAAPSSAFSLQALALLQPPTCRNVVLVRLVNSMVEFKQIIGRGTRVRDDYGKRWFN
ncbi:MAG: hypothetical protein HY674_13770, partial [Chloroflexi bacterium]|nr:hypothetical protein [Chloroflexota bacterium]